MLLEPFGLTNFVYETLRQANLTRLIEYEISLKDLKRLAMRLTDEAQGAVEFGRFRLLPHRRELRADGVAVELGSRAFDVLMVLTEARGALVTKDEIMARVWPETVVEENNLVVQISALRRALGEDRDFIRTVSGRGYRFIAEIRNSVADPSGETGLEPGVAPDASTS